MSTLGMGQNDWWSFVFYKLKKALEDLQEALAEKEELAQRCQELDLQVRNSKLLISLLCSGAAIKMQKFWRAKWILHLFKFLWEFLAVSGGKAIILYSKMQLVEIVFWWKCKLGSCANC